MVVAPRKYFSQKHPHRPPPFLGNSLVGRMPSPSSALLSSLPPPSLPHASVQAGGPQLLWPLVVGPWWKLARDPAGTQGPPGLRPPSATSLQTASSLTKIHLYPSLQMLPMTDGNISSACCRGMWMHHINRPLCLKHFDNTLSKGGVEEFVSSVH